MRSILRNLVMAPVVLAAACLASNTAMAAEAKVDVPFNFTVAGKTLPAGSYRLVEDSTRGMVTLKSLDASQSFTWLLRAGDPTPTDSHVTLRFDRDDQSYALRTVQYRGLITPRLDKKRSKSEHQAVTVVEGQ